MLAEFDWRFVRPLSGLSRLKELSQQEFPCLGTRDEEECPEPSPASTSLSPKGAFLPLSSVHLFWFWLQATFLWEVILLKVTQAQQQEVFIVPCLGCCSTLALFALLSFCVFADHMLLGGSSSVKKEQSCGRVWQPMSEIQTL